MGFSVPWCSRFSERICKACGRNLRRTHNLNSQIKSVLFKNHGVGVKFRFERFRREINFDRARSTTVKLTAWSSEICNQATTGKTSFRASCLYIRNGKLDTKWRSRETKSRKENSRAALDGKFIA